MLAYMTTFGVDDWLFVINLEIAIVFTVSLKFHYWPVIAFGLHLVLMLVTKLAPHILESYTKHLQQAPRYWPGASPLQTKNLRPLKFGRNESDRP